MGWLDTGVHLQVFGDAYTGAARAVVTRRARESKRDERYKEDMLTRSSEKCRKVDCN